MISYSGCVFLFHEEKKKKKMNTAQSIKAFDIECVAFNKFADTDL